MEGEFMKKVLILSTAIVSFCIISTTLPMEQPSVDQSLTMQRATLNDWRAFYNFMTDESVARYAHGPVFGEYEQGVLRNSWKLYFGIGLALAGNTNNRASALFKDCTAYLLSSITGRAHDSEILRFEKLMDATGALRAIACIYRLNPDIRKAFALQEKQKVLDKTAIVVDLITKSTEDDQTVCDAQRLVMENLFADTQRNWQRIFTHKNPKTPTGAQVLCACAQLGMQEIATKDYACTTLAGTNRQFPLMLVYKER